MIANFVPGWEWRPKEFNESLERMAASGPVAFGDAKPEFKGWWKRLVAQGVTGVFLWNAEIDLFGKPLLPEFQRAGTCVGRGNKRAVQYSWYNFLTKRGGLGTPVEFCYEVAYAGSRVVIGKSQLGNGDGSIGAWLAEYLRLYGFLPRGVHGSYDLTRDREDLAVSWGRAYKGPPRELVEASAPFKAAAAFDCRDIDGMADSLSSDRGIALCSNFLYGANDQRGYASPEGRGGHCEAYCGVFLNEQGGMDFCKVGSWGKDYPGGGRTLRYAGGEIELPVGVSAIKGSTVADSLRDDGEAWSYEFTSGPGASS